MPEASALTESGVLHRLRMARFQCAGGVEHNAFMARLGVEQEVAAIGWFGDGVTRWRVCSNVHTAPAHNFAIAGGEIRTAIQQHGRPDVLWHTHNGVDIGSAEPSKTDVETFPDYIFSVGVVYAPHLELLTAYNKDGVLWQLSTILDIPLATQE